MIGEYPMSVNVEYSAKYCRYKELPYPDYAIAPVKKGYAEQREFNNSCDTFIVGSDQLFTGEMMRILDGYSDLEWVKEKRKAKRVPKTGY